MNSNRSHFIGLGLGLLVGAGILYGGWLLSTPSILANALLFLGTYTTAYFGFALLLTGLVGHLLKSSRSVGVVLILLGGICAWLGSKILSPQDLFFGCAVLVGTYLILPGTYFFWQRWHLKFLNEATDLGDRHTRDVILLHLTAGTIMSWAALFKLVDPFIHPVIAFNTLGIAWIFLVLALLKSQEPTTEMDFMKQTRLKWLGPFLIVVSSPIFLVNILLGFLIALTGVVIFIWYLFQEYQLIRGNQKR